MQKSTSHEGHRSRLRERFSVNSSSLQDHELLELLLFYAIPRKDTNDLAHMLLGRFGSISGVMEAPEGILADAPGMGKVSAQLFSVIQELSRRYMKEKVAVRGAVVPETLGAYLWPDYLGVSREFVRVVGFNRQGKIVGDSVIGEGSEVDSTVSMQRLSLFVAEFHPVSVVLVHNHPSGAAVPSDLDYEATDSVRMFLACMGVALVDHLIFDDNGDYTSFAQSGLMNSENRLAYQVGLPESRSVSRAGKKFVTKK